MLALMELLVGAVTVLVLTFATWAVLWKMKDDRISKQQKLEIQQSLNRAYEPAKNAYTQVLGERPGDINTGEYSIPLELHPGGKEA